MHFCLDYDSGFYLSTQLTSIVGHSVLTAAPHLTFTGLVFYIERLDVASCLLAALTDSASVTPYSNMGFVCECREMLSTGLFA